MTGIKNCTEEVVEQMLDLVLEKYPNICQCEKCRSDIAAIALNHLPVYYVSTDKGKLIVKSRLLESQIKIDVIAAITQAVEMVAKDVRHN